MADINLSPPWYIFRNELAYTVGLTPGVKVGELKADGETGDYILDIYVSNYSKADSIRQIIKEVYEFGNVNVTTIVHDLCSGKIVPYQEVTYKSAKEVANLFCKALRGNCFFVTMVLTEGKLPPIQADEVGDVVLVTGRYVVQFYDDDISDLCSNYNEVAAVSFQNVIRDEYNPDIKVGFTTYDPKCILPKDFYCNCNCRRY